MFQGANLGEAMNIHVGCWKALVWRWGGGGGGVPERCGWG